MSEELVRRRKASPERLARRAERLLMAPYRASIAELQTRITFIAARAVVGKSDPSITAADYDKARADIARTLTQIDAAIIGPGLGPADDCRRALRTLMQRLP